MTSPPSGRRPRAQRSGSESAGMREGHLGGGKGKREGLVKFFRRHLKKIKNGDTDNANCRVD